MTLQHLVNMAIEKLFDSVYSEYQDAEESDLLREAFERLTEKA